jgi:hypothetical protein
LARNLAVATFHVCEEDLVNDDILLIDRELETASDLAPQEIAVELSYADAIECGGWQQDRNYRRGEMINFHDCIYAWKHLEPGNSQPVLWQSSPDWQLVANTGNRGACAVEGKNAIKQSSQWRSDGIYDCEGCVVYQGYTYIWKHFYAGNNVPIVGQSNDDWELISRKASLDSGMEGRIGEQGLPGEKGEPGIPAPEQLNIYLVYRCDSGSGDWDEPDAIVVIAKDETAAQQFAYKYDKDCSNLDPRFSVAVKYLGTAAPDLKAGSIATAVQGLYRKSLK